MFNIYKTSNNRVIAAVLTIIMMLTSILPGLGDGIVVLANTSAVDGTTITTPEEEQSYYFDFLSNSQLANAAEGTYGLLTLSNGVRGNSHGPAFDNGTSITLTLAESSKISIGYCAYDTAGTGFNVVSSTGSVGQLPIFPAKTTYECYEKSGKMYSFNYTKESEGVQSLTIHFTSTYYIPYLLVEPLDSEGTDTLTWAQKDFSLNIGDTTLSVVGAPTEETAASATVTTGNVYYALAEQAMVSFPAGGSSLKEDMLTNLCPDVVDTLQVNTEGEIVVTFKDQTTLPHQYIIKVQDRDNFVTPGVKDVFSYNLAKGDVPTIFDKTNSIASYYTTNNGILTIGKGTGTQNPYWHDATHGLAINDNNYLDIVVAGDAAIVFDLCAYGNGGTLAVESLPEEAAGSFDSNSFKGSACNDTITYTYTGDATTLRFVLTTPGESYLHGVTVKNTGAIQGSPVANEQAQMPSIVDSNDMLSILPFGHKLIFSHSDSSASISKMTNVGYYLFDATTKAHTMEADIKINAVGGTSSNGIFIGMFDPANPIQSIATLGIRGDKKVRNVYTKTGATLPSAGSIDQLYSVGDTLHVKATKVAEGWYTEVTINDQTISSTIKYSAAALFADIDSNVRFGFAFANVDGIISNLTYTDEDGSILYDQTNCYDAVGSAPTVFSVETPVVSSDRTNITVAWSGSTPKDDGAFKVELSTNNGLTYNTIGKNITDKEFTTSVQGDGQYCFRITGVCGATTGDSVESAAVTVMAPLDTATVKAESGDSKIELSWTTVSTATSYEIYRKSSDETEFTKLIEVENTFYNDANVVNETPYYYFVVAKSNNNTSNPSRVVLSVPSAGRNGEYVYEEAAANIFITKKSYDTVFSNEAILEGVLDRSGKLDLNVNGQVVSTLTIAKAKDSFSLTAPLVEGRNDVNLLFTDKEGNVTRKSFNFVYLTNYHIVVESSFNGTDGDELVAGSGVKVFKTVQAAVDSVPSNNTERVVILVKEGSYVEHLVVSSPYITLIGEDRDKVNINFFDAVESPVGGDTAKRPATYIKPSAVGFTAENITFENTYNYLGDGTISNESADALRVDAENSVFVNVKLLGYQDTLQSNTGHQYYYKCYISGNIDYIYGTNGQALFEDCDLVFRYNSTKNSGYITAPKHDASLSYGYLFNECRIYAEDGCNGSKYLLARPWGPDGAATFINTYMGSIINKGNPYSDMSGNLATEARFSEYFSYGAGYAINSNRPQISKAQAEEMLTTKALGWDPYTTSKKLSTDHYDGTMETITEEKFVEQEYIDETADPDSTDDTGLGAYGVEGFASATNVTGGGLLLETATNYHKVNTAEEFLSALATAKQTGKPSVIELTEDIELGSKEIGDAITKYSSIIKPHTNQPLLHPTLLASGVSTLTIKDMSNLTIYSKNGSAITHAAISINNSSNIIIRNIIFDELWEWDEFTEGNYDRNDWDFVTVENGSTGIWIDHCTFYKAYDGIVDVKKAVDSTTTDVTISWSKFLPESENEFFDVMMDLLESNPENYPYYKHLMDDYDMTKEQIRAYASAQKKTHLIGASDIEANIQNLQLTLANNYYKNSMDRMPRLRGGIAHVYNCIMDAADMLALKDSLTNPEAAQKVVSNGIISTCDASVLVENTYINGIMNALNSGNGSSPAGAINAINSIYYLRGKLTELEVQVNNDIEGSEAMITDPEAFISNLPYGEYVLYNATTLDSNVLPYVGAGTITMTATQWLKTSYNDEAFHPEEPVIPEPTATPTVAPTTKPTTTPTVTPTVTPAANPIIAAVKKFKVTSATATTATLSWSKVTDAKGYVITYKNAANKSVTKTVASTSLTVRDLAPNKTYSFSIKAYKTVNKKNIYSSITKTTGKTTKLANVANVKAKASTTTSITLSWNKVTDAAGYVITYQDALNKKQTVTVSSGKTLSKTIKKLATNKSYKFTIKAYTIVNGKRVFSDATYKTLRTTKLIQPIKVTSFKVKKASKNVLTLTVKPVKHAAGYQIAYSTKKSSNFKTTTFESGLSKKITSLKPGKTYYVKVRAYTMEAKVVKGKLVTKKVYGNYSTVKKYTLK